MVTAVTAAAAVAVDRVQSLLYRDCSGEEICMEMGFPPQFSRGKPDF